MSIPTHRGGGHPDDPDARYVICFDEALKRLKEAADLWSLGDPETPTTEAILERLLEPFQREKFLKQPW